MSITNEQKEEIKRIIRDTIRKKLLNYKPETDSMPFHYRLLGRDRMALFSFIHSLNTAFGTSIFEPVAEIVASSKFQKVIRQFEIGDIITEKAQIEIMHIINELASGRSDPDKKKEIEIIRKVCKQGKINKLKTVKADIFVMDQYSSVHLFDIKTAKPNISSFKDFKKTLLEWVAIYLYRYPDSNVNSYIAIPYNPYEPKPYERWTLKGILDLENELKVAEEFWDFLGGQGTYQEILDCFEIVGIELRPEIDKYFSKFKNIR
ncbi:MAG: TdeIII family type II restriction endonuclease [Candidatus Calescibacterium sp.]|nr:TdeIII family type II restriction endonuclease [Candidatus Calescibacterium sp.]